MASGQDGARRPLVAGNWKMYKLCSETRLFMAAFLPLVVDVDDRDIVVCPPFTGLQEALSRVQNSAVSIGAQTMHQAHQGAFTGEVSADMLVEIGVQYVILGHSERRQFFNENDADLPRKVRAALDAGLSPILCVGETLDEREAGLTEEKIAGQLEKDLALITDRELPALAVAYEPIWAIGTGRTATPEMAQETIGYIRRRLADRFASADRTRILYGGSVKAANIDALMAQPDLDGVLVGGASLQAEEFARIVGFQA